MGAPWLSPKKRLFKLKSRPSSHMVLTPTLSVTDTELCLTPVCPTPLALFFLMLPTPPTPTQHLRCRRRSLQLQLLGHHQGTIGLPAPFLPLRLLSLLRYRPNQSRNEQTNKQTKTASSL